MSGKRKVLDHGFVRLVDNMGNDLSIARSARISHDAEWRVGDDKGSDARLINFLYKNRHTTPFESVTFTFEVKAPIFVFRQWHRHRTQSYNEVSARYTELPEEFYIPDHDLVGVQHKSNKQMRDTEFSSPKCRDLYIKSMLKEMRTHNEKSFRLYKKLINASKFPRELARSVLPVATYSHMFTTMNLHNLFHFLRLRLHEHAQYEIRVYAQAMIELIKPIVPVAVEAFENE